jgi:hypothetical protein
VVPLRFILLQFGLALLPASALMKNLEARSPVVDLEQASTH